MLTVTTNPTRNPVWGFFGTMNDARGLAAPDYWNHAVAHLVKATGLDGDTVAKALDSRWGRHYADQVLNGLSRAGGDLDAAYEYADRVMVGLTRNAAARLVRDVREAGNYTPEG